MKAIITILCALFLTGCASTQYQAYADAHKAQAAAQTARYEALAKIAEMGDTTAKVAAVQLNATVRVLMVLPGTGDIILGTAFSTSRMACSRACCNRSWSSPSRTNKIAARAASNNCGVLAAPANPAAL